MKEGSLSRYNREQGFDKVESLGRERGGRSGEGTFLQKGPLPHTPSSLPPKTFDWWGGGAAVRFKNGSEQ